MSKSLKSFFLIVFSMGILLGCSHEQPPSEVAISAPPSDTTLSHSTEKPITGLYPLQDFGGFVYGAAGEDGFYSISSTRADGSTNIQYTDYETMESIPLCSQINCTHDSDVCTSWLPYNGGGTSLMTVGEQLILAAPGQPNLYENLGDLCLPNIRVCALDGSNRKLLVQFSSEQRLLTPYLTDGEFLYVTLQTLTEERVQNELIQIDLSSGNYSTLIELDNEHSESVLGASGEYIFFNQLSDTSQEARLQMNYTVDIYRYNINTAKKELIAKCPIDTCRRALLQNTLVTYDRNMNCLTLFDCVENKQQAVISFVLPNNLTAMDVNLIYYDAPYLLISYPNVTEDGQKGLRCYQTVNFSTQEICDFERCYSVGDRLLPDFPIANIDEQYYFVVDGEEEIPQSLITNEGATYYLSTTAFQYGKIKKSDYWTGQNTNQ